MKCTNPEMETIPALRLTPELLAQIDAQAEREDRRRPDMIRILLKRGLAATPQD